jgi:phenylalanine-4-hydroxylase
MRPIVFDCERAEDTPQATIDAAEKAVEDLQNNMGELSEMAQIRNLHWWTVEYGLIGTVENPWCWIAVIYWRKCTA